MNTLLTADYYAETHDEKIAGKLVVRRDTVVACYTLPKYRTRTMILTEQGLKFCIKGRPEDLMKSSEELLQETTA